MEHNQDRSHLVFISKMFMSWMSSGKLLGNIRGQLLATANLTVPSLCQQLFAKVYKLCRSRLMSLLYHHIVIYITISM